MYIYIDICLCIYAHILIVSDGEFYTVIRRMYMYVYLHRYMFMYICTHTDHGSYGDTSYVYVCIST